MFFDWLAIEQDFGVTREAGFTLPFLSDIAYQRIHVDTGEGGSLNQPAFQHKGSFCDSVSIKIRGSVLRMSGNPSRWGRCENLFGLPSVDACVAVFNGICRDLGLPEFTKCTFVGHRQALERADSSTDNDLVLSLRREFASTAESHGIVCDGAIIKELHITSNVSVGQGNEADYLSGLSTQRYRNSIPNLHTNGKTVDWKSVRGNVNLIYPCVYDKANELELHTLPKIKSTFGEQSEQYQHICKIIQYCRSVGIVRFEQKLKSRYLQKEGLNFWGLSDFSKLNALHDEFIRLDEKLQVTAMDFETISERLVSSGVVDTTRAANTTAMYAIQWMHGHTFDFDKKAVQTHRARLRRIGIDIAQRCNISKFSPIFVRQCREVKPVVLAAPSWYQMPRNYLRVA